MRKTPQHFRDQINSLGMPKRDTVGLRVTNRAPAGFNTVNGYFVCNGKVYAREHYTDHKTTGLYVRCGYFSRKGDAHVVKSSILYSLAHEIGHHVTLTLKDSWDLEEKLNYIISILAPIPPGRLGLRKYSLTNWKELLADCYAIRYTCAVQWDRLVKFFNVYGVDLVAATAA